MKKICLLKFRQEDLPFKAPSRRFALKKLRQEHFPFKAPFVCALKRLNVKVGCVRICVKAFVCEPLCAGV